MLQNSMRLFPRLGEVRAFREQFLFRGAWENGEFRGAIVSNRESTERLRERVTRAAEAALADHHNVSPLDILCGLGWMSESDIKRWHYGTLATIEEVLQTGAEKVNRAMSLLGEWAAAKGLKPSETGYLRRSRDGVVDLQFTVSGDPSVELFFRTHYFSPALSQRKQEKLKEKLESGPRAAVFHVIRDSECSECGTEVMGEDFVVMDAGQPLCLACARLDHLEYLQAGDATLTRRATKFSSLTATVVRFSRSRNRYERQGILVEPAAIEKAEASCLEDADQRAIAREQGAKRRSEEDRRLVVRMAERIAELFPRCPPAEVQEIAAHTAKRGRGRVGRSEAGRKLDDKALTLAVGAAVRHRHTKYDALLMSGVDREIARSRVYDVVQDVLHRWRED